MGQEHLYTVTDGKKRWLVDRATLTPYEAILYHGFPSCTRLKGTALYCGVYILPIFAHPPRYYYIALIHVYCNFQTSHQQVKSPDPSCTVRSQPSCLSPPHMTKIYFTFGEQWRIIFPTDTGSRSAMACTSSLSFRISQRTTLPPPTIQNFPLRTPRSLVYLSSSHSSFYNLCFSSSSI